jgi:hypothetical protein
MDSGPAREERASRNDGGGVDHASIQPEMSLATLRHYSEAKQTSAF